MRVVLRPSTASVALECLRERDVRLLQWRVSVEFWWKDCII